MASDELDELRRASEGLLYPSESDAPFEVVRVPAIKTLTKGRKYKEQTPDEFFAELVASDDGERYRVLRQTLESQLKNLKVIRIGSTKVEVYVIGQTPAGQWAGLKTISIET